MYAQPPADAGEGLLQAGVPRLHRPGRRSEDQYIAYQPPQHPQKPRPPLPRGAPPPPPRPPGQEEEPALARLLRGGRKPLQELHRRLPPPGQLLRPPRQGQPEPAHGEGDDLVRLHPLPLPPPLLPERGEDGPLVLPGEGPEGHLPAPPH